MKETVIIYAKGIRISALLDKNTIEIGPAHTCDVQVPKSLDLSLKIVKNDAQWQLVDQDETFELATHQEIAFRDGVAILAENVEDRYLSLSGLDDFWVSPHQGAQLMSPHLQGPLVFKRLAEGWEVSGLTQEIYHNNLQTTDYQKVLDDGDTLSLNVYQLQIFKHYIVVSQNFIAQTSLAEVPRERFDFPVDYPDFHRSPRLIFRNPEEKITIKAPQSKAKESAEGLVKLIVPPLIMLGVTIAMSFMRANALYVIGSAATTLVTLTFSIINYFKNKKQAKKDEIERISDYEAYLEKKAIEVRKVVLAQRQGENYHFPNIEALTSFAKDFNSRIYEKTPQHFDFLHYRLGLGEVKLSSDISYSNSEQDKKGDDLDERGFQLYYNNRYLYNMPISSSLMKGPVGYVGARNQVLEQLHLLVMQLSLFHSYHDLQFVTIFPESEKAQWDWMRWLPHATLQGVNVRGFVYNQRSRDQVLNSLNQILKNRKNELTENRENTRFSPHYVVLITDEKLVMDHVIMEFFNEDPSELGVSVIFVQDVMSSLSENIKTVIDIRDRMTGRLVIEEGVLKNIEFEVDHFPEHYDMELMPRRLAGLNHLQNLKSSIPESVTFLEMYQVTHFDELSVWERWGKNSPHKTLAVPLGLRGKDDIVMLNLHEKAHGPHGLVAGTTGSGKSEIIQSYILSLAVNFHPYDVAFLLIDYKGGGMANLFRDLPHLLGTITNLDGAQSMRALISINAELKRRQRLFSENNVNHINQYQKLYKNGDVTIPMPHLFLISDEFAELKAEQPEFMNELISTARIGRSLGVHLILATQKPSGVVNDQIWSNSKFKLALKVADKSDSNEIIKTPDAAEITLPGRAYLQVGNNEIYELFQSAWSGADYQAEKDEQQIEDKTIYRINDLGQYDILNEDLSGLEHAEEIKEIPSELEAVIQGIHDLNEAKQIEALPRPWLPPLPTEVYVTSLHDVAYQEVWQADKSSLKPVIGLVDIPTQQVQETLSLDLSSDGHLLVYASPGYGKSTVIQTVVMDLARAHNPAHLHIYLLDFGTNGLLPLKDLPHVADILAIDEEEKIGKFVRRLGDELKFRKRELKKYAVASLAMYERATGTTLPTIFIALDSFEGLKESPVGDTVISLLTVISREGAAIGIHLMMTAGRPGSLRTTLSGNFKIKIPLFLNEDSPKDVVGRSPYTLDDQAGRGFIKLEEAEIFQVALPVEAQDDLERIEKIQAEAQEMSDYWTGERPEEIAMVPEELYFNEFKQKNKVKEALSNHLMPIGLNYEKVEPVVFSFSDFPQFPIFSSSEEKLYKVLGSIINFINMGHYAYQILDDSEELLSEYEETAQAYSSDKLEFESICQAIFEQIEDREDDYNDLKEAEEVSDLKDFVQTVEPLVIIVPNISYLTKDISETLGELMIGILKEGPKYGVYLLFGALYDSISGRDATNKLLKSLDKGLVLGKFSDQTQLKGTNLDKRLPKPDVTEGYLVENEFAEKVKLSLID